MLPPLHILEKHVVPAGGEASVNFNTIAAQIAVWDAFIQKTSRHLCILVYAASEGAVDSRNLYVKFNGDAGNNYNDLYILGLNAAPSAAITTGATSAQVLNIPGTNYADAFGGGFILIPHAFNALNHKSMVALGGSAESDVGAYTNRWASNNAITSILLEPGVGDFVENSVFYLCVVDERYQIGESILSGADGTFSFPNIEARDGDLVAIGYLRTNVGVTADNFWHEINADTTAANYFLQSLGGDDTPAISASGPTNNNVVAVVPGDNATANVFGALLAFYPHFAGSLNDPNVLALSGYHEEVANDARITAISARRNNVEAINRIDYTPGGAGEFKDGSMMSIYRSPSHLIKRHICMVSEAEVVFDRLGEFSHSFEAIEIRVYARTDRASADDNILIAFNDDVVNVNYDEQVLYGVGAVPTAARSAAYRHWLSITGTEAAGANVNEFGCGSVLLLNYANNYGHKHGLAIFGRTENCINLLSCRWENTNPITKITLTGFTGEPFLVDSVFEVYGIVPIDAVIRPTKVLKAGQSLTRRLKAWRS